MRTVIRRSMITIVKATRAKRIPERDAPIAIINRVSSMRLWESPIIEIESPKEPDDSLPDNESAAVDWGRDNKMKLQDN